MNAAPGPRIRALSERMLEREWSPGNLWEPGGSFLGLRGFPPDPTFQLRGM